MKKFEKLSSTMIDALKKENITEPTQVQAMVISKVLENKDLIVESETGERVIIVTGCINALVSRISGTLIENDSCIA